MGPSRRSSLLLVVGVAASLLGATGAEGYGRHHGHRFHHFGHLSHHTYGPYGHGHHGYWRRPLRYVRGSARAYTETCPALAAVKGARSHPAHRARSSRPASRAIRSSSLGHA